MLKNLATSLILFERVETTEAKAKAVRGQVEKILGLAKRAAVGDNLPATRTLFASVADPLAAKKAVEYWAPKLADRPSGYVRLTRLPARLGDGASVMQLEIIGAAPFAVTRSAEVASPATSDTNVTVRRRGSKETKTADKPHAARAKKTEDQNA